MHSFADVQIVHHCTITTRRPAVERSADANSRTRFPPHRRRPRLPLCCWSGRRPLLISVIFGQLFYCGRAFKDATVTPSNGGNDLAYTKLFSSIVNSTIWQEDDPTRIVWITMLATADKNGEIHASIPGLARLAGVSIQATEAALVKFLAPDRYSRTQDDEGRRIDSIDGGWMLLNYQKYRRMASLDEQAEKNAERQRRFRERHKRNSIVTPSDESNDTSNAELHENNAQNRQAEADSEAEAQAEEKSQPNLNLRGGKSRGGKLGARLPEGWQPDDAGRTYARERGLDPTETAAAFTDHWIASNTPSAVKRDWAAAFRTWCRRDYGSGGQGKSPQAVRTTRGNDPFYERLAIIADRDRDDPPDRK